MPFDPTKPAPGDDLDAVLVRLQLNSLKDLIDAIPIITSVVVDSVTTLGPGESATATFTLTGTVLHISLALPRGADGLQGIAGVQGPAFANAVIDSVTTLNPGENATVSVYFDGNTVHLSFGIPRGLQGEQGIQGVPGEVTTAAMNGAIADAIAGTSANTDAVPTLDTPFTNDPLSLADGELLRANYNALVLALRR